MGRHKFKGMSLGTHECSHYSSGPTGGKFSFSPIWRFGPFPYGLTTGYSHTWHQHAFCSDSSSVHALEVNSMHPSTIIPKILKLHDIHSRPNLLHRLFLFLSRWPFSGLLVIRTTVSSIPGETYCASGHSFPSGQRPVK